jgi:hypothetical protein
MLYSQDRQEMRHVFREAWRKHQANEKLEKLESLITELITLHPEYQPMIKNIDHDNRGDAEMTQQAFMHLSLHLAIREQVSMNQPLGILSLYQKACEKQKNPHEAEHLMMDALYEMMILAQANPNQLDDSQYLQLIQKRL